MNEYLLDTHILLWWLAADKKLSDKKRAIITKPENTILVSAVTIWEIVIKKSLKKLNAPDNLLEILDENNLTLLPMTAEHALYIEQLPQIHADPFDRLLVAQSAVEDLILVTEDRIIPHYGIECL